jgi:hypothetical protein
VSGKRNLLPLLGFETRIILSVADRCIDKLSRRIASTGDIKNGYKIVVENIGRNRKENCLGHVDEDRRLRLMWNFKKVYIYIYV